MCHFLKSTIGALFPLPINKGDHLGDFDGMSVGELSVGEMSGGKLSVGEMSVGELSGYHSPVPIFQATMESMTMKGFSMLLQTVFWGCFINSIHNMSYYMEVSSCPTLPLSWVSNCPVSKCPVSKCPVSSCPVSIVVLDSGCLWATCFCLHLAVSQLESRDHYPFQRVASIDIP